MSTDVELSDAQRHALAWLQENKRFDVENVPRDRNGRALFNSRSFTSLVRCGLAAAELHVYTSDRMAESSLPTAFVLPHQPEDPDIVTRQVVQCEGPYEFSQWHVLRWEDNFTLVKIAECRTAAAAELVANAIASYENKRVDGITARLDRIEALLADRVMT
ncbi:MAG: hypothetical protein AB7L09_02525 [Nitrospira sp.]